MSWCRGIFVKSYGCMHELIYRQGRTLVYNDTRSCACSATAYAVCPCSKLRLLSHSPAPRRSRWPEAVFAVVVSEVVVGVVVVSSAVKPPASLGPTQNAIHHIFHTFHSLERRLRALHLRNRRKSGPVPMFDDKFSSDCSGHPVDGAFSSRARLENLQGVTSRGGEAERG
jgi:hypothetical protein